MMPATANEFTAAELKALYDRAILREQFGRYEVFPPDIGGGPRVVIMTAAGNHPPAWGGAAPPAPVQVAFGKVIQRRWAEIYAEAVAEVQPVFKAEVAAAE